MINYQGKHVIVVGASGGMGRIISEMLADKGVKLALYSNDAPALEELANALSKKTELVYKVVDVCSEEEVKAAEETEAKETKEIKEKKVHKVFRVKEVLKEKKVKMEYQ